MTILEIIGNDKQGFAWFVKAKNGGIYNGWTPTLEEARWCVALWAGGINA